MIKSKDLLEAIINDAAVCFRCGKKMYPTIEDINLEKDEIRLGHKYLTIGGKDICDDCAKRLNNLMSVYI